MTESRKVARISYKKVNIVVHNSTLAYRCISYKNLLIIIYFYTNEDNKMHYYDGNMLGTEDF